ncbi:3'-5' ssDNA/RNA exonuclease TatD, partial [Armadillidium vulgare]
MLANHSFNLLKIKSSLYIAYREELIKYRIHPHEAKSWDEETLTALKEVIQNQEVVAIGECGLDFNRNFSLPEVQKVQLACEIKKPLFIHEREAYTELMAILTKYKSKLPPIVIHCFTGDSAQAKAYLDFGCYIGLTGYVWKDKSEDGVRKILESGIVPLDRLMVETDSPFMYPNTRASKLPPYVKDSLSE